MTERKGGNEEDKPVPSVSLDEEMEDEDDEDEVMEAATAASSGREPARRLRSSSTWLMRVSWYCRASLAWVACSLLSFSCCC